VRGKLWFSFVLIAILAVSGSCIHDSSIVKTDPYRSAVSTADVPANNEDLLQDVSKYRTDTPSEKVQNLSESFSESVFEKPGKNLPNLVEAITEDEDDDFRKIKNIHDWIALHISYDDKAYLSGRIPEQSYTSVLKRRRGVCDGYAGLFRTMCEIAGFECTKVRGYSRGYGYEEDKKEKIETNHAWNAVRIGEAWYLVDVTWDAGYLSDSGSFVPEYETSYLFIPPGGMVYTHFPDNRSWQLLKTPYSRKEFLDLPYLTGEYYMVFDGPPQGLKKENRAESGTVLELPPHSDEYKVSVSIMPRREQERYHEEGMAISYSGKHVFIESTPEATLAHVRFPEAGTWYVKLGARNRQEEGAAYTIIARFLFEVEKGSDTFFPGMGFRESVDYTIHEPLYNPLKTGEKVRFSFTIEGRKTAVLYASHYDEKSNISRVMQKHELTAEDGTFEHEMVIPPGANEVSISIRTDDSTPDSRRSIRLVGYEAVE
jgi:hypothetical protein